MKLQQPAALPQAWLQNISVMNYYFLIDINIYSYYIYLPKHVYHITTTLPKQKSSFHSVTKISKREDMLKPQFIIN